MATRRVLRPSIAVTLAALVFAASGCGQLTASKPTLAPSPVSTAAPSATSRPPTLTAISPAPTTTRSAATVTRVTPPTPIAPPTTEPATLSPSVLAAVNSFRAQVPNGGPPSPGRIEQAQAALEAALTALVSSGDAASQGV